MKFSDLIAQKFPKLKSKISEQKAQEELLQALYLFRKEFGLSHEELMNEPWPAFDRFWDEILKFKELERKEYEKARKRK